MTDLDERLQHASRAVRDRVGLLLLPDLAERGAPVSRRRSPVLAAVGSLVVVLLIAGLALLVDRADRRGVAPGAAPTPRIVDVDVHELRPGTVLTSRYTFSGGELHHVPVFVARQKDGRVLAFLGRSTHLGCKIVLAEPATIRRFTLVPNVVFVDPCGGSLWALNGTCLGGPCPRSLDQFQVEVVGVTAHVDLSEIIRGKDRAGASPPSSRTKAASPSPVTSESKSVCEAGTPCRRRSVPTKTQH